MTDAAVLATVLTAAAARRAGLFFLGLATGACGFAFFGGGDAFFTGAATLSFLAAAFFAGAAFLAAAFFAGAAFFAFGAAAFLAGAFFAGAAFLADFFEVARFAMAPYLTTRCSSRAPRRPPARPGARARSLA